MTGRPADGEVGDADVASALASIWPSVLDTPVSATDSFFDLNGDSFAALRVLARIRAELGFDISIADLLDYPEFGEFTVIVQSHSQKADVPILSLHERADSDRPALVAGAEGRLTYRDLRRVVSESRRLFECRDKALVAIFCDRDTDSVTAYLTGLSQGHACGFFGDVPEPTRASLVATYQPEFVVHGPRTAAAGWLGSDDYRQAGFLPGGAVVHRRKRSGDGTIFGDLALLLATSGSTGSPKVVRISQANLHATAVSIATALEIDAAERAITSLPLGHCYGLSVLNSQLVAGASIALCGDRVLSTRFWRTATAHAVTSFAGAPAVYELLRARRFDPAAYPSLTTSTQAGGKLSADHIGHYADRPGSRRTRARGSCSASLRFAPSPKGRPGLPDDQDLAAVITSTEHLCATCPMGAGDDGRSVVDPECRVLGVDGRRVIDSSVIPDIPRANPHLTVVMIAEHMAMRMTARLYTEARI